MRLVLYCLLFSLLLSVCCVNATYAQQAPSTATIEAIAKEGYLRLMFRAEGVDDFTLEQSGKTLRIHLDRPVSLALDALPATAAPYVTAASLENSGRGIVLSLGSDTLHPRKFIGEGFFGFDLIGKIKEEAATAPEPSVSPAVKAMSQQQTMIQEENDALAHITSFEESEPHIPQQKITPPPVAVEKLETVQETATPLPSPPVPFKFSDNALQVERIRLKDGINLIFPWPEQTGAAIFTRGPYIWVVFARHRALHFENLAGMKYIADMEQIPHQDFSILRLKVDEESTLFPPEQGEKKQLLRLQAYRDGFHWMLSIREAALLSASETEKTARRYEPPLPPKQPVTLEVVPSPDNRGSIVNLPVENLTHTLEMKDPMLGNTLIIIPIEHEGTGVSMPRHFVEFSLLPTIQGIAIERLSDRLRVETNEAIVRIISSVGLSMPERGAQMPLEMIQDITETKDETEQTPPVTIAVNTIFPFHTTIGAEFPQGMYFRDKLNSLYTDAAQASKKRKSRVRLKLAQFLFENQLYHEAYAELRYLKDQDPTFEKALLVDTMLGATLFFLRDYMAAEEQFKTTAAQSLQPLVRQELLLWQWASQQKMNQRQKIFEDTVAINFIDAHDRFMQQYPTDLIYDFGLMATEEKLERNDIQAARSIFAMATFKEPPQGFENYTNYVRAKLTEKEGNIQEAETLWSKITEDVMDRKYRALSGFELAKLQLKEGRITVDEAIDAFNKLDVVWRGEQFEIELLKLTGQLLVKEKQYLQGLRTWRSLTEGFPDTREAILTAGRMKRTFVRLFDRGEAYELPPLTALALYFEFRDLTPLGPIGDRIIQELAGHFIKADLLENAALLLAHQARFRASGKERQAIALQLADVYMKNVEPQKAIEALDELILADAPQSAQGKARILRARALLELGRFDETERILGDDYSEHAKEVRARVAWSKKDWIGVIQNLGTLRHRWRKTAPFMLPREQAEGVVRLAVAYTMKEEWDNLSSLQKHFDHRLPQQQKTQLLAFLAEQPETLDTRNLDETLQLASLESFLTGYTHWPVKNWQGVATMLAPRVKTYEGKDNLAPQERDEVIQLAVAYAQMKDDATAQKNLAELQRSFGSVVVDKDNLGLFNIFNSAFKPLARDAAFARKVALKDIGPFVEQYQAARSISELNAAVR